MARWQSGSRERLAAAALRLFADQGFERTTVAEIAAAAGLTERTFFRYYTDKPEVLFTGQEEFEELFLAGLDLAAGDRPIDLIAASIDHAATFFPDEKRPWSRDRQLVVAGNVALQERELHKMSTLATTLTAALVARGIDNTVAALAAEAGVSVFRRSFAAWIAAGETRSFAEIQRGVLGQLHALMS
jgi:AcrR family transcriptional regulator